jgi:histone acetyltransferase (RNA polymerase elongator complex component)
MIIPFFIPHSGCPHQCVFCNQKNITGRNKSAEACSVPRTIDAYLRTDATDDAVQIAFYGGSFTALPIETQKSYLEASRPFIESGQVNSIRLSTRPDCITREVLVLLRDCHVEIIELGAQSLDDRVLALSGRGHSAADTRNAVQMLREHNFTVGLQLMPGLPGDSAEGFMNTVDKAIALQPDCVRLYPTLVIRDTPLEELYAKGRYAPLALDEAVSLCRQALLKFEGAGIKVIRIGLQPTEELERPGTVLAGPYHPAFRQLVESSIFLDRMKALLANTKRTSFKITFLVHPRDVSAAVGQKRSNLAHLKEQFACNTIRVRSDQSLPRRAVKLITA